MDYIVSKQRPWDDEPYIEIACGRDEISPGMLTPTTPQEGDYDNRKDAATAAVELQENLANADTDGEVSWPIKISRGASIGLYGQYGDEYNTDELNEWVSKEPIEEGEDEDADSY